MMDAGNAARSRRAVVIINPVKSPGEEFKSAFDIVCAEEDWSVSLWLGTTAEYTGDGQARIALEGGADVVISAGGDGAVHCVAEVVTGTRTQMGVVPLGTGNQLAGNLGIAVSCGTSVGIDAVAGTTATSSYSANAD
jgi:diacylglycerol kinase (ATP)